MKKDFIAVIIAPVPAGPTIAMLLLNSEIVIADPGIPPNSSQ